MTRTELKQADVLALQTSLQTQLFLRKTGLDPLGTNHLDEADLKVFVSQHSGKNVTPMLAFALPNVWGGSDAIHSMFPHVSYHLRARPNLGRLLDYSTSDADCFCLLWVTGRRIFQNVWHACRCLRV